MHVQQPPPGGTTTEATDGGHYPKDAIVSPGEAN